MSGYARACRVYIYVLQWSCIESLFLFECFVHVLSVPLTRHQPALLCSEMPLSFPPCFPLPFLSLFPFSSFPFPLPFPFFSLSLSSTLFVDAVEAVDSFALPVSGEITLAHGRKPIEALDVDPAGTRIATGGYDSELKLWDFGGMDSSLKAFRTLTTTEG